MTVKLLFYVTCQQCGWALGEDGEAKGCIVDGFLEHSHADARALALALGWLTLEPSTVSGFRPDGPTLCPRCRPTYQQKEHRKERS